MSKFMIHSTHTDEECSKALREFWKNNPKLLEETFFGCLGGDHSGWTIVEASSESEARNKLQNLQLSEIHVVKVDKFTPGQLKFVHEV